MNSFGGKLTKFKITVFYYKKLIVFGPSINNRSKIDRFGIKPCLSSNI